MNLRKRARLAVADYVFNKKIKSLERPHQTVSLENAKKIGIIYDATDEEDYEVVTQYLRFLRNKQKEVKTLGYVDNKKLPENKFAKLGIDFFTRKHLNWCLIPTHPLVTNFINEKFDILINLSINKCFPLQYISAVSQAKFRVGRYESRHTNYNDLMINLLPDNTLKQFIQQIDHYLNLVTPEIASPKKTIK
jgi:hypothetical protein